MVHNFLSAVFLFWMISCISGSQNSNKHAEGIEVVNMVGENGSTDIYAPVSFENEVLPILKSNCNPCHFTGGKMYATMPFDQATTITSHAEGILKRFKKESEAATISRFIEEAGKKLN